MGATSSPVGPVEPTEPRKHLPGTGWWHAAPVWLRRTVRQLAIVVMTGIIALTLGIFTASAETRLGPHEARISTNVSHTVRLDLGPLGSLDIPSPAPWPLGVQVDVGEVPATLTEVDNPLQTLSGDVAAYAGFFADPEIGVREAAWALVADVLRRTVLVWSILLVVVAVGQLAAGGLMRREIAEKLRRRGVAPLAIATAVAVVAVPASAAIQGQPETGRPSAVLTQLGGPLAEARVSGQVAVLLDTYGELALEELRKNDEFYDVLAANVRAAYAEAASPLSPPPRALPVLPWPIAPDPVATPARDPVTLMVVSDIHCNTGIGVAFGEIARQSQADIILNAGDTTLGGSSVESLCVDRLARALPADLPVVVADGNHDSRETSAQEARAGWRVLDGSVIDVEGVTIVGDVDSRLTSVTLGTHEYRTRTEAGRALQEAACAEVDPDDPDDYVDILLLHDPYTGGRVMPSGCVGLEISGHLHRRIGPVQQGLGLLYLNDTSGGAHEGAVPLGPLQATAYVTIIEYDRASRTPVALREVAMYPDQHVELGEWEAFPDRPTEVVVADLSIEEWPAR